MSTNHSDINVAVVIPLYKSEPYISVCLEALAHQMLPARHIVAVDDTSPDQSALFCTQAANKHGLPLTIVTHQINKGFAAAVNTGIAAAVNTKADYALLLNADAVIAPDYIKKLVLFLEAHGIYGSAQGKLMRIPMTAFNALRDSQRGLTPSPPP